MTRIRLALVWARCSCACVLFIACQAQDRTSEAAVADELAPDSGPLARLTTEQYNNTVRDLFPQAALTPISFPPQLAAAGGFENNAIFNAATSPLTEAYNRAAARVSATVDVAALGLDCELDDSDCARAYVLDLSERAWRRPIEPGELEQILGDFNAWATSYGAESALQLTIQSLLQSPDFLYFPRFGAASPNMDSEAVALSSWEMASRMSYFLWNTMPDAELFALARADQLRDRSIVTAQAWRMLADQRARRATVNLHRQLFDLDDQSPLDIDFYAAKTMYDSDFYYQEYLPDVRYEPEVFIMQHIFEGEGTLAALLSSNKVWVTPLTAHIAYDMRIPPGAPSVLYETRTIMWEDEAEGPQRSYYEVELDPTQRAGLFTLASFLSAKANPRQPSPVKRGVVIIDRLLCTTLVPPGDVPALEEVEAQEPKTNREKYALHTAVPACQSCHERIDGIGFSFEHYDSLGAWRDQDNGYPIDATGTLLGTDVDGPVTDAVDLMHRMAGSRTIHDCYVKQLFRYAFGRNEVAEDLPTLGFLQEGFWQSGGDIPELLVNITASYEFRYRRVSP